jgi:hypothetical protein
MCIVQHWSCYIKEVGSCAFQFHCAGCYNLVLTGSRPIPLVQTYCTSYWTQSRYKSRGPGVTSLTWVIKVNFFHLKTYNSKFRHCCFTLSLGAMVLHDTRMILIDFMLHYVRKLSCKFELFWIIGCGEQDFWMTPPYNCIFVIISPLMRICPVI